LLHKKSITPRCKWGVILFLCLKSSKFAFKWNRIDIGQIYIVLPNRKNYILKAITFLIKVLSKRFLA